MKNADPAGPESRETREAHPVGQYWTPPRWLLWAAALFWFCFGFLVTVL